MFGRKNMDRGGNEHPLEALERTQEQLAIELEALKQEASGLQKRILAVLADIESASAYLTRTKDVLSQRDLRETTNAIAALRSQQVRYEADLNTLREKAQMIVHTYQALNITATFGGAPNIEA